MNNPDMKKVFQGELFSVWQWKQKMYDGSTRIFERIEKRNAAGVIGVLPDKRILLVWDEQPDRSGVLTPAGGGLEEGESPEQGARREFEEETGYSADSLALWFSYSPWKKLMYEVHFFIAKDIQKKNEAQQSAGEKIELRFFTFDEFLALGQDENLRDMRLRIMLLEAQLDPQKRKELEEKLYG